jgi:hypothetical protein
VTIRPEPARPAADNDPRLLPWMKAWLVLLAAVFLVPSALLARTQWQGRRHDRLVLETTLDPARPEPGAEPIDDVPTDAARRVTIGFYLESLSGVSLHDGEWSAVIDVWCRWRDEPGDDAFSPFERLIAVDGTISDARLLAHVDGQGEHYELRRLSVAPTRSPGSRS